MTKQSARILPFARTISQPVPIQEPVSAAPEKWQPGAHAIAAALHMHADHIGRVERAYRRGRAQGRLALIRTIDDWYVRGTDDAEDDARSLPKVSAK